MLVTAIDVVEAVDLGRALRMDGGEDQGCGGAEIAGHHRTATESLNTGDACSVTIQLIG